jgi:hypothetical protein
LRFKRTSSWKLRMRTKDMVDCSLYAFLDWVDDAVPVQPQRGVPAVNVRQALA